MRRGHSLIVAGPAILASWLLNMLLMLGSIMQALRVTAQLHLFQRVENSGTPKPLNAEVGPLPAQISGVFNES